MAKNPNLPHWLKLCRMGHSLYFTIPRELVLAHNLNQHDDVYCVPEPDGIKLKFTQPSSSAQEASAP